MESAVGHGNFSAIDVDLSLPPSGKMPPHAPPRPAAELETGSSTEALRISPAAAPSTFAAGIMATAIAAILQPPHGSPPFLFHTFFVSIVSAVLLSVVAHVLDRILRHPLFPQQLSAGLNLPLCIMFLEGMAYFFLFMAFLSSAFILLLGQANRAGIRALDFFPALILLLVLLMSLCCAFRLAVYNPPAGSGEQQHKE